MKKLFNSFFKKKRGEEFTGFEVRIWKKGKLMTYAVSSMDEIFCHRFPEGQGIRIENSVLFGYKIIPMIGSKGAK